MSEIPSRLPARPSLEQLRKQTKERLKTMRAGDRGIVATEHLAGLRLKSYYAGKTRITDRSLEILGRMQSLEKLEFWETAGITDAGIAALAGLPRLREISVGITQRDAREHGGLPADRARGQSLMGHVP